MKRTLWILTGRAETGGVLARVSDCAAVLGLVNDARAGARAPLPSAALLRGLTAAPHH
jgi:hypothetical protein